MLTPGSWLLEKDMFKIATKDGYIQILEIQPEGKRKMSTQEYLNGIQVTNFKKPE